MQNTKSSEGANAPVTSTSTDTPGHPHVPAHLLPGAGFLGHWSACHTDYTDSHRKIGWCEMFAALYALLTYASLLQDQSVILVLDNQSDVSIINRQATRSQRIAVLLRAMFDVCYRHNISVHARHLPGVDNVLADFLSRRSLHRHKPLEQWTPYLQSVKQQAQSSNIDTTTHDVTQARCLGSMSSNKLKCSTIGTLLYSILRRVVSAVTVVSC